MKYLVYTRVSPRGSDWHGETSCEAQFDLFTKHALARDPQATFRELREEFITGTKLKGRKLAAELRAAEAGQADWDVLGSLDIERMFRSTEESLACFRVLHHSGKGVMLVRPDIDLSTPYGRFTLTILSAVAELIAKIGQQKTRDAMFFRARQGLWPAGKVPLGYRRGPKINETPDNRLQVDPAGAETVRAMFAAAAKGDGPVQIARAFGMPRNTVNKILSNPIYLGRLVYGEIDVPGKHEAIVPADVWKAAQPKVQAPGSARTVPRRQTYAYLLAGRVRCVCGGAMSPAVCHGKGGRYAYYRCQEPSCKSSCRSVRADQLDTEVIRAVTDTLYSPQAVRAMVKGQAHRHKVAAAQAGTSVERLRQALEDAQRVVERATKAAFDASSSGFGGASRALLADLDAKQQAKEALQQELATEEARLASSLSQSDTDQMMAAWLKLAQEIAAGEGDEAMRRNWATSHVKLVRFNGEAWCAEYFLPLRGGSTQKPQWHPEGASVELVLTLVVRHRGRAA